MSRAHFHPLFCPMKNQSPNHRVNSNVKSANRPTSAAFARPRQVQASFRFKSAVLKRVHINQASSSNDNLNNGSLNEEKTKRKKKNHRCGQQTRSSFKQDDIGNIGSSLPREARSWQDSTLNEQASSNKIRKGSTSASQQPILSSNDRRGLDQPSVRERKKDPRLNGADLCVARIGRGSSSKVEQQATLHSQTTEDRVETELEASISKETLATGSLYDELNILPTIRTVSTPAQQRKDQIFCDVAASQPCYRCIMYMHSAGIRRVLWTNEQGNWEESKVRGLVAALDGTGVSDTAGNKLGGLVGDGLFVTKHEVFMLRRLIDGKTKT